jgi:mRNA interferase MazF
MKRGEIYRVRHPSSNDPKRFRAFVIVSRQVVVDSKFSTVICAPIYTRHDGLASQVAIGPEEGVKHESSIHCDELISLPKTALTNFVGMLSQPKQRVLDQALLIAFDLQESLDPDFNF